MTKPDKTLREIFLLLNIHLNILGFIHPAPCFTFIFPEPQTQKSRCYPASKISIKNNYRNLCIVLYAKKFAVYAACNDLIFAFWTEKVINSLTKGLQC